MPVDGRAMTRKELVICSRRRAGETLKALADDYGLSISTIFRICAMARAVPKKNVRIHAS